ncbi:MAG: uracil-DNA glycosylase [Acidimicrobiales bacterium]
MTELSELAARASSCRDCRLASGRTTVVFGEGSPSATLMVIGEGPGRDEDLQGRPFVGRSGRLLDRLLAEEAGFERAAVYIANVVKCRPPENRDPKPDEIEACRPYLDAQVALISPKVIITLGNFASKTLLRSELGITRLRGRVYPWPSGGDPSGDPSGLGSSVVVPTFHPAAALRGGGEVLAAMRADFVRARRSLQGVRVSGEASL